MIKNLRRKILVFTVCILILPAAIMASQIPEYLCELGLQFYRQGRYAEALHEFKKALIAEPNYEPAQRYIQMLEQQMGMGTREQTTQDMYISEYAAKVSTPEETVDNTLDLIELQKEMIREKRDALYPETEFIAPAAAAGAQQAYPTIPTQLPATAPQPKKPVPPIEIALDSNYPEIKQPVELEQGRSIIVTGSNIKRFLITQPGIINAEKTGPDELTVTGKDIGYTYLHVWDDTGRWTMEILGVYPKPEGPTYEELLRREEERAGNFKFRYSLDWNTYETGRRLDTVERQSYGWSHGLALNGPTPYGDIDSVVRLRRLKQSADITYYTAGLTNGRWGPFKGFSLRAFDFAPNFSNLAFPGTTLRGTMLASPAFNNKFDYTVFWGREGGGRYGNLSPGLAKTKNSFVSGTNMSLSPTQKQNYRFTVVHGWGRDRGEDLNPYSYDLTGNWLLNKWGMSYEIANDSETFGHLFNLKYNQPNVYYGLEIRNIDKDFNSITGTGWRAGELGGLFTFNYNPTEKFRTTTTVDVYRDRLYPAEETKKRYNEDVDWSATYQFDPDTNMNMSYTMQNDLGKLSQYRYLSPGIGFSKTFRSIRNFYTYFNYYRQENKNYATPATDYINDRIYAGIRFSLIGELYYYINKEIDWLNERFTGNHSRPNALETGIDWTGKLTPSRPFYGTFRFTYRDEENTLSPLSFLSGEDYVEGYSELAYRTPAGNEIYSNCRVRNVWSDNPNITKRIELDVNAGMRYTWDTGVRWESVGNVEGYVFRDLNSDGLRQRDEPPVEGVKIWLGKDKNQTTDLFGYYKFKGVRAKKAFVNIDTSTLPVGYVLTGPVTQETPVIHHRTSRVDFGIISRTEITGVVFEDVDEDGQYSLKDEGVSGVIVILDDTKKAVSDTTGKYSFTNVSTADHVLTLDLTSLPVYFLPKVAVKKEIALSEGSIFNYNIPLKRVKK